ncbi:MAG TPA: hypothetical protein VEX39_11635 [Thermoleophilaceae bacterium]|nr:hypothetical protein [Thermoleophilaceae bacterium]
MGQGATFEEVQAPLVAAVVNGATVAEAAVTVGAPYRTVKRWLARGRSESDSRYVGFAAAIDAARERSGAIEETDLSEQELEAVAWRAARAGSVLAMRLCWELLQRRRVANPSAEEQIFLELDEIALRRLTNQRQSA